MNGKQNQAKPNHNDTTTRRDKKILRSAVVPLWLIFLAGALQANEKATLLYYGHPSCQACAVFERDYNGHQAFRETLQRCFTIERRNPAGNMSVPTFVVPERNLQVVGYSSRGHLLRQLGCFGWPKPRPRQPAPPALTPELTGKLAEYLQRFEAVEKKLSSLEDGLKQQQQSIKAIDQWIAGDKTNEHFEKLWPAIEQLQKRHDDLQQQTSHLNGALQEAQALAESVPHSVEGLQKQQSELAAQLAAAREEFAAAVGRSGGPAVDPFHFVFEMVGVDGQVVRQHVDEPGEVVRIKQIPVTVKGAD